jgi:hypothetical protein
MKILKITAAAVISSVVIGSASIPGWSGTTGTQSVTAAVEVVPSSNFVPSGVAERSWLEPSAGNAWPKATTNCRPGMCIRSTILSVTRSPASSRV